jgi:dipeptidyl aminopeptidase/acylaminoacyl peptidase
MNRLSRISLILMAALASPACAKDPPAPTPPGKPAIELGTSEVSHLRIAVESLGSVPNSGLLLPEVSSSGNRIAYLEVAPPAGAGSAGPGPDSLITGKDVESVSLSWRDLKRGATPHLVCPSGALWPAWFPDGKRLAFVVYDTQGRAALGVHDLDSGQTKRWGVGVKHVMMPAISPDGRRIAIVGYAEAPADARIILIEPDAGKTGLGPVVKDATSQLGPQWLDANTLLFVGADKSRPSRRVLYAWSIGRGDGTGKVKALRPLNVSGVPVEFLQAFVGLGSPVNAAGNRLAYYDSTNDAITLIHLTGEETRTLPRGTRAGVWLGETRFAAATEKDLSLYSAKDDRWQTVVEGAWLPRWADERSGRIIALGASKAGSEFVVDRLTLRAAEEMGPNSRQP